MSILQSAGLTGKNIIGALSAGIAISLGCIAFLITGNAWLFPIGLFIVCFCSLNLFTGKICYLDIDDPWSIIKLIIILIFNITAAALTGLIIQIMQPDLIPIAQDMVANKMTQLPIVLALKAILCNVLIFIAVDSWKKLPSPNNIIGLIFATAVFVFCGYEHCIANAFYFGLAGRFEPAFFHINIMFNAIGGIFAYRIKKYMIE